MLSPRKTKQNKTGRISVDSKPRKDIFFSPLREKTLCFFISFPTLLNIDGKAKVNSLSKT